MNRGKARKMREVIEQASASLPDETALEGVELFPKWIFPFFYQKGTRFRYGDTLYKVLQDHTSQEDWPPDKAVSLYVRVDNPAIEWPEWVQPTGAHDAYEKGKKVSHNGKHWISEIDANIYEPGVYGWENEE